MLMTLIRHGVVPSNETKKFIGRTDESLSVKGRQEVAEKTGTIHLGVRDGLYVSPAKRAVETAQILFPDRSFVGLEGLWEMNFGVFDGYNSQELEGNPEFQKWVDSQCEAPIPQGEQLKDFKNRVAATLAEIASKGNKRDVIVAHGGVIMAALSYFEGSKSFYDYWVPNVGVVNTELVLNSSGEMKMNIIDGDVSLSGPNKRN